MSSGSSDSQNRVAMRESEQSGMYVGCWVVRLYKCGMSDEGPRSKQASFRSSVAPCTLTIPMFSGTGEPVIVATWAAMYTGFAVCDGHGDPSVRGGLSADEGSPGTMVTSSACCRAVLRQWHATRNCFIIVPKASGITTRIVHTYIQQQVLRCRKHSYRAASKNTCFTVYTRKREPDIQAQLKGEQVGHSLDRTN